MVNYWFHIDWSNDGVWTNAGENVTRRVLQEINITYGRDQARALSPVSNGSCGFELDNQSRDYSPENSTSPLVGTILPARPIRIMAASNVLSSNADFESNSTGWTAFGGSSFARSNTFAYNGSWSGRLTSDASSTPRVEATLVAVTAGVSYRYNGFLYSPISLPTQVYVGINWYTSGSVFISTSLTSITLTAGVWGEVFNVAVAPSTAAFGQLAFGFVGTPGTGKIVYGDDMRLTTEPTTLFRGHIDEYVVLPAKDERKVTLTGLDPLAKISQARASTALYQSIRTGDAIAAVLDSIGWDARARDLDAGASTLRWWCLNDEDAWSAIQDIIAAEGAPALITADGNGNVVFRDRHHRLFTTLISNPTFEGSIANWVQFGGTISLDNTVSHNGQSSAKFVPDGVTAVVGFSSETVPAVAATRYTISGWIMNAVARSVSISVNWFTSSMVYISTTSVTQSVAASTWTYFYGELTAPATTAFASVIPTMTGTPAASNVLWADNVRISVASTNVTTFRDQTTEPKFSAPFTYDQGWRDVVNDVNFKVDERGPATELTEIWRSDAVYNIPVGGSLTLTISTSEPFYGAAVSTMTVLSGSAGISINNTAGQTTDIFITDGGSGAQVTGISLVGYVVSALRTFQISSSDSSSITTYGAKAGQDNVGKASVEDAQTIADLTVLTRKVRLPIVQVTIKGSNDTRMNECLNRNLSDRVKVIDAETGLNRDFFIEQITHNVIDAGALHTTTFGCEAVSTATGLDDPNTVFIFDHPTNGKFGTGKFGT